MINDNYGMKRDREDRFKWQRGVNCVLKFHNKLVEYFPT